MPYVMKWEELPEYEVLPNNFRKSVAGLKVGINLVRWIHPTKVAAHRHEDSEQAVLMIAGRTKFVIDDEEFVLEPGDVCVIPAAAPHSGESVGEGALFYEVFSPMRVQNLYGFLGKIF